MRGKYEQMTRPQLLAAIKKLEERCHDMARVGALLPDIVHWLPEVLIQARSTSATLQA